ncbi:MAG: glycosyltransferase family 2 protein [Bacteroidota bacterium]
MLKITVITVNYNNGAGLRQTIESVLEQNYDGLEYIVVDGASTDDSVEIIKQYQSQLSLWISEPDTGVYQAMNKGIRKANGDYLLFLNSGDTLYNAEVLKWVGEKIQGNKDIYYGNLMFHSNNDSFVRNYPKQLRFSYFLKRSLPHPGSFIKRTLFERLFYYSEDYRIVSDWEFFLFAVFKTGISYEHLDAVISKFDLDGMSNDPKNNKLIKKERAIVLQKHFPGFYQDYQEMTKQRIREERKDLKLLRKIQQSKTGRRVVIRVLKFLSLFFGTKTKE